MSDQKLVSPLLDGFVMGDPMSSHDGVRCCPAMKENSDDKYIVKIISVPASQKQLDALLLTGAYKDAAAAMDYFKELSDGVVKEAELLQQLSRLEGFLPYEGWQVVPMEENKLGYEVYLVGSYKRSLEKYLRRNTMTHLGAVNLGLDLCAALAICRRAGYMFVDLKPTNIYLTGEREYRIGDLGFVKLSSMKYTSMPSKYRSCYTPPELHDALATLNPTVDVYAVGMILYQIYNNGVLPFEGKAPGKALPAPANADYEMAEIIGKACAPNPRNRYQTPIEMGQALVSYMQRNTINDVPIIPPVVEPPVPAAEPEEAAPADEMPAEEAAVPAAEAPEELSFMEDMVSDETAPDEDSMDALDDAAMSDEVSSMLAQADELLSHEVPDAASVQEPLPAEEPAEAEQPQADAQDGDDIDIGTLITGPEELSDEEDDDDGDDGEEEWEAVTAPKKKKHSWVGAIILILVIALLGGGGYYFYENYYLLNVDQMYINGVEDTITVELTTDIDESLLTVVCTDTYGNKQTAPVSDGKAVFTELNPGTQYIITLEVEGFHKLDGSVTGKCETQKQTNIIDFTVKTGTEDGSVILNFTVEGPETQDWMVEYTAEGEETKSVSFTGHMVAINGLTVGKTYTFRLMPSPGTDLYLVGSDTLEFTASKIVVAENLSIVSCVNGVLTTQWSLPADTTVESWTVRCYADDGYDETVTVTDTTAEFSGISAETAYTVEVLAAGMTQSARTYVTANPTTVTNFAVEAPEDSSALNISWEFEGTAPEGGWLLMYSIDGSEAYEVITCTESKATIDLRIPKSTYNFTLKAADGSTVFGGISQYTCPEAPEFNDYSLSGSDIQASLCYTPDKEGWTYKDIADDEYTSTFTSGAKASFVLYGTKKFYYTDKDTTIMFVIRDAEGNVLADLTRTQTKSWKEMWNNRYCSLDIPAMPTADGSYTIEIYFNNAFVLSKDFSITVG